VFGQLRDEGLMLTIPQHGEKKQRVFTGVAEFFGRFFELSSTGDSDG
jgi:hypothetical protein